MKRESGDLMDYRPTRLADPMNTMVVRPDWAKRQPTLVLEGQSIQTDWPADWKNAQEHLQDRKETPRRTKAGFAARVTLGMKTWNIDDK